MFFSQSYTGGHTPCCQSVARQVGCVACGLPGVSPLSGGSNACVAGGSNACVAGGMIMPPKGSTQRGIPPLGDSLVTFSSGRKLPGARGGAPAWWVQELSAPQKPRGAKHGKAMLSRCTCSILPFCLGYTEKRTNFFYLPQKHFAGTRRLYAIQGKFKKRWKRRRFRAIMRTEFCRPAAFCTGRRR